MALTAIDGFVVMLSVVSRFGGHDLYNKKENLIRSTLSYF